MFFSMSWARPRHVEVQTTVSSNDFASIESGTESGVEQELLTVLTTDKEWRNYYAWHSTKFREAIDFNKNWIAVIHPGEQSIELGVKVIFVRHDQASKLITIAWTLENRDLEEKRENQYHYPFQIIAIKAKYGYSVRFVEVQTKPLGAITVENIRPKETSRGRAASHY